MQIVIKSDDSVSFKYLRVRGLLEIKFPRASVTFTKIAPLFQNVLTGSAHVPTVWGVLLEVWRHSFMTMSNS